jgi:amino acid adenylation domain-containing protein
MDDPSARPPEPAARAPGTPQQDGPSTHREEAALTLGLRDDSAGTRPASVPGTAAPWLTNTGAPYPRELCVAQLVEAQVKRSPEAIALMFAGEALAYRELNRRANQLAHYLRALGVGPETLVGVCVERSLEMVIAVLATLKAGGAYVPLDPTYPRERLAFILQDTGLPVLLTQERLAAALPAHEARAVLLDPGREAWAGAPVSNPTPRGGSERLAYVMYTSGSTGKPKGVQIPHRAVVNFLWSMRQRPGLSSRDTLLAVTTLSFDISVLELFLPLVVGARVVLAARETAADGARLAEEIDRSGATVMQATPATWRMLLEAGWQGSPRLKILCGGEALSRSLADQLLERGAALWNLYGPTETTVWSTLHAVAAEADRIPLGLPIANTRLYVLGSDRRPVPAGVAGELYIGGDGLARGYLNRPELTAERFIPIADCGLRIADLDRQSASRRVYRTGDLVCVRPDGNLDFLGRMDYQVKIRGHRIEPGEVEVALGAHPAVAAAAVVARADRGAEKRLVAYLVCRREPPPAARELHDFLKARLPAYMVPGAFIWLGALPLTPNGKVDRAALPPPGPERSGPAEDYLAPRSEAEKQLQQLWEKVLETRPIGVRDDFFAAGGDSLRAVRLCQLIKKTLGREVALSAFHQGATIERLAEVIAPRPQGRPAACLVPIRPDGDRPPLFLVHGIGGRVLNYIPLARHLAPGQPVYGFQARGLDGAEQPLTRVGDMAACYLAELRGVRPRGPYHLGGYSFGGLVAFEMARLLSAAGERVALLAILDEPAPQLFKTWRWGPLPAARFLGNLPGWLLDYVTQRSPMDILVDGWRTGRRSLKRALALVRRLCGRKPPRASFAEAYSGVEVPESFRGIWEANYRAEIDYRPGVYAGRLTLLRARVQPLLGPHEPTLGWGALARGGVDIRRVPGNHVTLIKEPHLPVLAAELQRVLTLASG